MEQVLANCGWFFLGYALCYWYVKHEGLKQLADKQSCIHDLELRITQAEAQIAIWTAELQLDERVKREVAKYTHE